MATDTMPKANKVALKKGFGLMDWVKLTMSASDLAGVQRLGGLRGYTAAEVREHRSEHDAWAIFMGKVYNITPYLHYHPGGSNILIQSAGRDCTGLFNRYHPWVNLEGLASKLIVGFLIEEEDHESDDSGKAKEDDESIMKLKSSDGTSDCERAFSMDPPSSNAKT